jgi:hypothetical protein
VRASLARRTGACLRCGTCCRLVMECIFCSENKGLPACRSYHFRTSNCRNFPLDTRDIADRNLVAPHSPCGYSWGRSGKQADPS